MASSIKVSGTGLKVNILMLSANPKGTDKLRLDEERREIESGLMERSRLRDNFQLIIKSAVRPRDFQRAMLDTNPQIVHFSGHGGGYQGLALEDETGHVKLVNTEALASLFELFADNVMCVVMNACYSEVQAKEISNHIPYVIGMSDQIGDHAAIEFAIAFYDALGDGRDIKFAYKSACVAIKLAGISEANIPVLLQNDEVTLQTSVESPHKRESHKLTEKQEYLLRWLVKEVRAGRLDGEEIWFVWTFDGTSIANYRGTTIPEVKLTTLDVLQNNGCLICGHKTNNEYRFALTSRAYKIVDSCGSSSSNKSIKPTIFPDPLNPLSTVATISKSSVYKSETLMGSAAYYDLVIRCPACVQDGIYVTASTQWYHDKCGGKLQIGDNAYCKCVSCGDISHIENWLYKCDNHDNFRPTTSAHFAHSVSTTGSMTRNTGRKWLIALFQNLSEW